MTTTTKWTPGPWREDDGFIYGAEFAICDPHCESGAETYEEREANVRLIVEAPTMIDLLLRYVVASLPGASILGLDDEARAILKRIGGE